MKKIFAPYNELKEVWLSNSMFCCGFALYRNKTNAAVAVKTFERVEICGCRFRVTYARPRRRDQSCRYHSNNMSCYQCGTTIILTESARKLLLVNAIEESTVREKIEGVIEATVETEMREIVIAKWVTEEERSTGYPREGTSRRTAKSKGIMEEEHPTGHPQKVKAMTTNRRPQDEDSL